MHARVTVAVERFSLQSMPSVIAFSLVHEMDGCDSLSHKRCLRSVANLLAPFAVPLFCVTFSTQPVPIIRKLETTSRDGELIPRTHPGPANMGDRFRHAFLADPIHDRHIKPPSLAKPSNRFAPDLAR